jgi:GT2 family glycosyltransferase
MLKIAIVIVNWNKRKELANLLNSLCLNGYDKHSIYVVDNASIDDSVVFVKSHYPNIILLPNQTNLGGSGGFNTGLRAVLKEEFDFVWLLDNDVEVLSGALESLLAGMQQDKKVAIVGSKILHSDNPKIVSEIGACIHWRTLFTVPFYENTLDQDIPPHQFLEADYVAACSLLARVSCVREVGLWEEHFFLMWDDMEWCLRFKKQGYRVIASTDSAVIHKGFSEREFPPLFFYYAFRNHLYFAEKTYSGIRKVYYLLWLFGVFNYLKSMLNQYVYNSPYVLCIEYALEDFSKNIQGKNQHLIPSVNVPTIGHLRDYIPHKKIIMSSARPALLMKQIINDLDGITPFLSLLVGKNRENLFSWYNGHRILLDGTPISHLDSNCVFVKFIGELAVPIHYQFANTIITIDNHCHILEIVHLSLFQRKRALFRLKLIKWVQFGLGAVSYLWRGIRW